MQPNGSKRRGFAVGAPARRSRDGTAKERCGVAKPWPRSGQTAPGRFARRNAAPDFARQTQKAEGPHAPVPASPQRDAAEGRQARRSPAPDADAACAQSAQELLQAAARAAVQMLVRTVDDENATLPQRMDAAKTILDRVYGKASQPIEGNGGAAVQVVMSKEVRELMG